MIRPVEPRDVPALAALHVAVFGQPDPRAYPPPDLGYHRLLFDNVDLDGGVPGYVVERAGAVVGGVAIMPRRIRVGDAVMRAAAPTRFMVAPGATAALTAVALLRHVFAHGGDLVIADSATTEMMRLWERAGGTVLPLPGLNWKRVFRPARAMHARLALRGGATAAALAVAAPAVSAIDWLLHRKGWNAQGDLDGATAEPCADAEQVATLFNEAGLRRRIAALLDPEALRWRLEVLALQAGPADRVEPLVIGDRERRPLGVAVLSSGPGASARLWKLGVLDPRHTSRVLHTVMERARASGALSLAGRVDATLLGALADDRVTIHAGQRWSLVHTADPDLRTAFLAEGAHFDRLDGEYW